jgi:hypothetical protein
MAECARGVGLGFWLCALPAVASVALLAWGLVTPGASEPSGKSASLVPVMIGIFGLTAGLGLALWALADYVQYGDFFAMFLMVS